MTVSNISPTSPVVITTVTVKAPLEGIPNALASAVDAIIQGLVPANPIPNSNCAVGSYTIVDIESGSFVTISIVNDKADSNGNTAPGWGNT